MSATETRKPFSGRQPARFPILLGRGEGPCMMRGRDQSCVRHTCLKTLPSGNFVSGGENLNFTNQAVSDRTDFPAVVGRTWPVFSRLVIIFR